MTNFNGAQLEVSYVFGLDPDIAATTEFGLDAVQTVTASAAPNTLDIPNLPNAEADAGNGIYGLARVDFGTTTVRIEFPLDPSIFAGPTVNFADEGSRPYNGVRIGDVTSNLASIRGVSIVDQAGFTIPLVAANVSFTTDGIFLNVNNPADGIGQSQGRLVDIDVGTAGAQPSYVTLSVDFVDEQGTLLSGNYWTGIERSATPVFVTYSFPTAAPASHADVAEVVGAPFQVFNAAQQAAAVAALGQWGAASGITFIEVPAGQGQINFALYGLGASTALGSGGLAFNPFGDWNYTTFTSGFTEAVYFSDRGDGISDAAGDVFINADNLVAGEIPIGLLLHEIGHAIGLKHPFETGGGATGVPHEVLDPLLDNTSETVMSYNGAAPTTLGQLDILAVQEIYGTQAQDGAQVSSWSWNAGATTLTQTGYDGADDIMLGVSVADVMAGGTGNDRIFGYGGNDSLDGGGGGDELWGGLGNDTMTGGAGADTFFATLLDSTAPQADVITDFAVGEDRIDLQMFGVGSFVGPASWGAVRNFSIGTDALDGVSLGNARLVAVWNGLQQSIIIQGATAAFVSGALVTNLSASNFVTTSFGARVISGTANADTLFGSLDGDTLGGGSGADLLFGDAGDDGISGDAGADTLTGGAGADTLDGGGDTDTLSYAGDGGTLRVEVNLSAVATNLPGLTALAAGSALDSFGNTDTISTIENVIGGSLDDIIFGSDADNVLTGGSGSDYLEGGAGNDTLNGGDGNDRFVGGAGVDVFNGDAGINRVDYNTVVQLYLQASGVASGASSAEAQGDTFNSIYTIRGSSAGDILDIQSTGVTNIIGFGGNDTITGSAVYNDIQGNDGNDSLTTGGGDDAIKGGAGDDTIIVNGAFTRVHALGGADNDSITAAGTSGFLVAFGDGGNDSITAGDGGSAIDGGAGVDVLIGGAQTDRFSDTDGMSGDSYAGGGSIDIVTYTGYASGATFDFTAPGADTFDFATLEWAVFGGGAVNVTGTAVLDRFAGGNGNDTISGGGGTEWIQGGAGNDRLNGDGDDDRLQGDAGNDTLNGGAGNDLVEGGADADVFAFSTGWGADRIVDFQDGTDLIDMTAVAGLTSFAQFALEQRGATAFVSFDNQSIQVHNTDISLITPLDFQFGV